MGLRSTPDYDKVEPQADPSVKSLAKLNRVLNNGNDLSKKSLTKFQDQIDKTGVVSTVPSCCFAQN